MDAHLDFLVLARVQGDAEGGGFHAPEPCSSAAPHSPTTTTTTTKTTIIHPPRSRLPFCHTPVARRRVVQWSQTAQGEPCLLYTLHCRDTPQVRGTMPTAAMHDVPLYTYRLLQLYIAVYVASHSGSFPPPPYTRTQLLPHTRTSWPLLPVLHCPSGWRLVSLALFGLRCLSLLPVVSIRRLSPRKIPLSP